MQCFVPTLQMHANGFFMILGLYEDCYPLLYKGSCLYKVDAFNKKQKVFIKYNEVNNLINITPMGLWNLNKNNNEHVCNITEQFIILLVILPVLCTL